MAGNPNWIPGYQGVGGRKEGSRNRRTQEVLDLIETRGDRDPIDIASEIANRTDLDESVRAPYVKIVADYKHSKMAATIPPRYVETS